MSSRGFRLAVLAAALLLVSAATAAAQAIKIAWDPSADPRVAGYMVFVGSAPGTPTSSVDVGNTYSFVFAPPQPGGTFYFSVASYGADHAVGEHSPEISAGPADGRPWALSSSSPARMDHSSSSARLDAVPPTLCSDDGSCYTSAAILSDAGAITALTASSDGRIFYVEDGRFIKAVSPDGGYATTLLDAGSTYAHVISLALDPAFATTGRAFTGEIEPSRNGAELIVASYRNVHDEFGERAVIATGFTATGNIPPLTADTAGHLFIAIPTPPDGATRSPYDGMVLRMNSDGTVPRENALASPVFAQGYDVPTTLVDDSPNATVLIAGYNGAGGTQVRGAPTGEMGSRSSAPVALLGRAGAVMIATPQADGSYHISTLDLSTLGTASAVAYRDGSLFIALRMADSRTTVLRLSRKPSPATY